MVNLRALEARALEASKNRFGPVSEPSEKSEVSEPSEKSEVSEPSAKLFLLDF